MGDRACVDNEIDPCTASRQRNVDAAPPLSIDLSKSDIRTVLWATGFRADYTWLDVPVLDNKGNVVHEGGVVMDAPGLYVLGFLSSVAASRASSTARAMMPAT